MAWVLVRRCWIPTLCILTVCCTSAHARLGGPKVVLRRTGTGDPDCSNARILHFRPLSTYVRDVTPEPVGLCGVPSRQATSTSAKAVPVKEEMAEAEWRQYRGAHVPAGAWSPSRCARQGLLRVGGAWMRNRRRRIDPWTNHFALGGKNTAPILPTYVPTHTHAVRAVHGPRACTSARRTYRG